MDKKLILFSLICLLAAAGLAADSIKVIKEKATDKYELVQECGTKEEKRIVETTKYVYIDNCQEGNKSCTNGWQFIDWTEWQPYPVEDCKTKSMKIDASVYQLKTNKRSCLQTENIICCWSNKDGGANLQNRADEYKTTIRSGESGVCYDLNDGLKKLKEEKSPEVVNI